LSQESVAVLAGARIHEKDYEGGLKIVEQAIARNSKAPVLHLLRVQILQDMGRSEDINQAYRTLINEYPKEANYRRLFVTALIEQGNLEDARAQLVEVANLLPRQVEARLDIVRIDYRLGGAEKAKETFARLIAEAEEPTELEFAMAAFMRQEDDFQGAEKVYLDMLSRKNTGREQVFRAKNELAALRLMEDKRGEAEALIEEILAADNRNPDALLKRAGLKIDDGELEQAVGDLRIILNDRPDFVPAKMLVAAAYEQKGDFSLAESEMAQAVAASGRGAQPSNLFARFLMRRGQPDRAAKVLTDSLGMDPTNVENLTLLASIRLEQQDWRGAEQVANALKTARDQDEIVSRILGAAYTGLKDYAGAIDVLLAEHDREPLGTQPLSNLIEAYIDSGRGQEAETFLIRTIEKTPDNYDARILLAQVEIYNKRVFEAKETLRVAIDADPARPEAYESLYQIYAIEGRRQDAGSVIEQGAAAIPDNDGLQVLLADNLISLDRGQEAVPIYERILARRPGDQIISNNLASLLAERNDAASLARAKAVAEVLKDSENAYFLDTYGWAAFRAGDRQAGIEALRKAVIAAPDLVDARYHLGVALMTVGEVDRARTELETVLKTQGVNDATAAEARRLLNQ
jgi:tetratricopeptide (TPR) repeat protein